MIKTKNRIISDEYELKKTDQHTTRHATEPISLGHQVPVKWAKAKDFSVYDDQGNKWIDMTSGIFVTNAGHANKYIKDAIKKQLDSDLLFAYQYITDIRQEFTKKLIDISPGHLDKVVLLNTGSEVTDIAYKLLRLWGKRNKKKYIITFNSSYHGRTLGSALISHSKENSEWSESSNNDIIFLDFPYEEGTKFDPSLLPPADEIAAFFLETYQGWGAWMYPQEYIQDLYVFARDNGALVCFDEVQSGFYRMGSLYGYMTYGENIEPDLVCLGKGISSSLPMAAVLGRSEVIDLDNSANLSGTHAGNALGSAACLANLEFLTNKDFQDQLSEKCSLFELRSNHLLKYDCVTAINARGMVTGIILDETARTNKIVFECIRNGVLPVCTSRESIKLGPPLTISIDAINEAFDVIETAIEKYL